MSLAQELLRVVDAHLETRGTETNVNDSPVEWAHALGIRTWSKQRDLLRSAVSRRWTIVKACNSSSKTFSAALLVLWWPLRWGADQARVVVTGPTLETVTESIFYQAKNIHTQHDLPGKVGPASYRLSHKGTNITVGLGRALSQTVRGKAGGLGLKAPRLLVIVDEAIGLSPDDLDTIRTWGAGGEAHYLLLSNPRGSRRSAYGKLCDAHEVIQIGWPDMPAQTGEADPPPGLLDHEHVDDVKRRHGEGSATWAWSVMGEFPGVGAGGLYPTDAIERACEVKWEAGEPVFAGLDPGGGHDPNELYLLEGRRLRRYTLKSRTSADPAEVAREVAEVCLSRKVKRIAVDATGVGAKHASELSKLLAGKPCEVAAELIGESARPERVGNLQQQFKNRRARWSWLLARDMRNGDVDIDKHDDGLLDELEAIFEVRVEARHFQVEPRDRIVERLGHSPDRWQAVTCAIGARDRRAAFAALGTM